MAPTATEGSDSSAVRATEMIDGLLPTGNGGREGRARRIHRLLSRQTYPGSLVFNLAAFALPALYSTLSKLWVAHIDSSLVVTTDVYTYMSVVANVLNDGLPRAAWLIIGDKDTRSVRSRFCLAYTLIAVQIVLGAIMTVVFVASSENLAAAFVPAKVRAASLTYVRISSVEALSSAMEIAAGSCTRALDHPDVPLVISSTKFVANIMLDLLVISKRRQRTTGECINEKPSRPSIKAFKILVRPGAYPFLESAIRNSLYLWLVSSIVKTGADYATAWGIFNMIRWGLVMVPVQALEASTLTFVGHEWGRWRAKVGAELRRPKASKADLAKIVRPAFISCCLALLVEVPLCIFLSLWGMNGFAFYLSQSEVVAQITTKMWKTIDWCYIFFALNYQIAAILLAASPRWYLYQALGSNFLWILPWAIAVTKTEMAAEEAWKYMAIIFGGALVFDFFDVTVVCAIWARRLMRGKVFVRAVEKTI